MLAAAPLFFLSVYLPGWAAGLLLCGAHGYYEHAHGTTSHYGRLYNLLLFNDGYHVEHHAHPSAHWTRLPTYHDPRARVSRWPAPIRWLEGDGLILLERLALRSPALQRFLLRAHEGAFRKLLTLRRRARRNGPTDCHRRWRAVPADRAGSPPDSSARAAHDHRCESRAPEHRACVADRRRHRIRPRALPSPSTRNARPLVAQAFPPPLASVSRASYGGRAEAQSAKAGRPADGRVESSPEGLRDVPIATSAPFDLVVLPLVVRRRPRRALRPAAGADRHRSRLALAEARRQRNRLSGPAQAAQPGARVKAASLFVVLALAKAAALWGHTIPPSWWSPIAYLWQDAAIALAFAAADESFRHGRACLDALRRADAVRGDDRTGGTRAVVAAHLGDVAGSARTARRFDLVATRRPPASRRFCCWWLRRGIVPLLVHRIPSRFVVGPLMACVALGPAAAARVDTIGLERNAWTALVSTAMPHARRRATAAATGSAPDSRRLRDENLDAFRACRRGPQHHPGQPGIDRGAVPRPVRRAAGCDAQPDATGRVRNRVRSRLRRVSRKHQRPVLGSVLRVSRVRRRGRLYEAAPCRSLPAALAEHGYRDSALSFRPLHVSRDGGGHPSPRLRHAGGRGRHRRATGTRASASTNPRRSGACSSGSTRGDSGRPFFLTYLPIAGHHPYESPDGGTVRRAATNSAAIATRCMKATRPSAR